MHRFIGTFLVALSMVTVAAAQNSGTTNKGRSATLADRIAALRQGWSEASDKVNKLEMPPTPQAAKVVVATDNDSHLPRIDPRDLLPKQWFGVAEVSDEKGPETNQQPSANGSARARLLRDMHRSPSPRAGSALSRTDSNGSLQLTPASNSVSRPSRATSALSRSIAADVAESLVGENDFTANDKEELEEAQPINPKIEAFDLTDVAPEEPAEEEAVITISPNEKTATGPASNDAEVGNQLGISQHGGTAPLSLHIGEQRSGSPAKSTFSTENTTASQSNTSDTPNQKISDDDLLMSQRMPLIVSRVSGPRQIVVGREATYRVTIANRGDASADQLTTNISVPEGAEVVGTQVSTGNVESAATSIDGTGEYVWQMDRLASGSIAKLEIRLIAHTGEPIELGVSWKHRPVDSSTVIEVQEPKLSMDLSGPEEVLYGKPQLFRLTLSNPGTGVAENVKLRLTPPGDDGQRSQSHDFGELAAGESRSVEIELTAREAGDLAIEASATADGKLFTEALKEIFCRRAELVVDWRGPKHRYTGAAATYYLRVRNPGTAVASNIELGVDLPEGFEVIATAGTGKPVDGQLTYHVGTLRPGDDRYFELKGTMKVAGDNAITLQANASDDTRSEVVTAVTEVVALADLKLDILDPRGPVATGEEIAYQIRITNRGSNEARKVSVVGLFSAGIEPHHVDGGVCTMSDGRVAFETIETIPAGAERVFTIHARAHEAGTHLFRAEVLCEDLEIKLAAEETTRFFEDETVDVASEGSGYRY